MKKMKHLLAGVTAVLICALTAVPQVVLAEWNPNTAVHITPKSIENSTLAVGTHLIHLSALSNRIFELAIASAAESSQRVIYYKSELGDGNWFNITTAQDISDISTTGTPVSNESIGELYFTYHTKSDGITYDLRTNSPVSIYDIPSPYKLMELEELRPLKTQFEYLVESNDFTDGRRRVQKFWDLEGPIYSAPEMGVFTTQIAALERYVQFLNTNDASDNEVDAAQQVLDYLDAGRRSLVFTMLEPELGTLEKDLIKMTETRAPAKLVTSSVESQGKVKSSNDKLKSKLVTQGVSVIGNFRYTFFYDLIDAAERHDNDACDGVLQRIIHLQHIETREIIRRADELDMLDKELTPSATAIYLQRAQAGENTAYSTAVQKEASATELATIVTANTTLVSSAQSELEFLIEEMTNRMEKAEGITLLDQRLAEAKEYYTLVPKDAFKETADASIAAHIIFLSRLREEVLNSSSEADKLAADKSDMESQLQNALDGNNLVDANALLDKISDLEGKLGDGNGELGNKVGKLKQDGLSAIGNGDTAGAGDSLDGLLGMTGSEPGLAYPAISSLRDAMANKRDLNGDSSFDGLIDTADKGMQDGGSQYDTAMNTGRDGDAARVAGLLSKDYNPASGDRNAAALGALGQYADQSNNAELQRLLGEWAAKLLGDGNPYIYIRINDGGNEYIPCDVLCRYTGMRYVWQQSERTGTMSKKGNYYSFTVGSTTVNRDKQGSRTEQMAIAAKYQDIIHLHESYTISKFKAEAYYIPGTQYGVLLTQEMKTMLEEILGTLKA